MYIEKLVNENYDKLTNNELQIFTYIKENYEICRNITCKQLAEKSYVSRTTLLRFCKKLNLNSFAELKFILKEAEEIDKNEHHIKIDESYDIYHKMVDEVKKIKYDNICSLIFNSEIIYIYGTGNAQKAEAEEFKRIFLAAGKCVIDLFDLGEIRFKKNLFTQKDMFVIISLSGETPEGIEILKTIKDTKIDILAITRFENNTIARMSTNNLYVGTRLIYGLQDTPYEMTAAFYVLLDILFVNYLEFIRGANNES